MDRQEKINLTVEILEAVALASALTVATIIAPGGMTGLAKLMRAYQAYDRKKKWQYRSRTRRAIGSLQKRGFVVAESKGEELIVKLTQAGRRWLNRHALQKMVIHRPAKWDHTWRIVVFDIPEKKRVIRNVVRGWLKRLSFVCLQQSVWVIPWPCQREFELLCAEYRLGHQAILLESKRIAKDAALRRKFKLL